MKENINEHDMTKKMLDVMRGGYKSKLLTEQNVNNVNEEETESPDTISPKQGDAVFNDELKKLQQTVDPRVKITNFKIYPMDNNVMIEGILLQRADENSGIHFKMSLNAGEIETSMDNIELDDKVSDALHRLQGYYDNWCDEWSLKLVNEYPPKKN